MLWLFRSIFALLVYAGITAYSGLRLLAFVRLFLPQSKALVFWFIFTILPYGFIALSFLRQDCFGFLHAVGMYLPPFIIFLSGVLLLFDITRLVLVLINRPWAGMMPAGVGFALVFTVLILTFSTVHAQNIKTAHYSLDYSGTNKLRVVLVSDLHLGPTVGKNWTRKIVSRINEASPDLVCMAGDIFDGGEGLIDPENVREELINPKNIKTELRQIKAPLGVYACPGNHDVNRRTHSIDEIAHFLSDAGITLLADETVSLDTKNSLPAIVVAGRRDARPIGMKAGRLSLQELYDNSIKNNGSNNSRPFIILLDHQPTELPETAKTGYDLVLCGHTHKGQFFPGNLFTRSIFKKAGGTHYGHWQKGNTQAIVSSGAGVWGPPIRMATNSEIAIIDVQF